MVTLYTRYLLASCDTLYQKCVYGSRFSFCRRTLTILKLCHLDIFIYFSAQGISVREEWCPLLTNASLYNYVIVLSILWIVLDSVRRVTRFHYSLSLRIIGFRINTWGSTLLNKFHWYNLIIMCDIETWALRELSFIGKTISVSLHPNFFKYYACVL